MFKIDFIVWKFARVLGFGHNFVRLKQTLQYPQFLMQNLQEFKIDFIVWKLAGLRISASTNSSLKQTLQYGNF